MRRRDAAFHYRSALTPMADKKAFLLRVDPGVWTAILKLAQAELRSMNAEIEFLLRDALARRGIVLRKSPPKPRTTRDD